MGIRISHSGLQKYTSCPKSYELHYRERIRGLKTGSALIFGSAVDDALNNLLETKMVNPPETANDDLGHLCGVFDRIFTYLKVNKEYEDVRTSHFVDYYSSDFDEWLLQDEDRDSLNGYIKDAGYEETDCVELYKSISILVKEKQTLDSTDLSYYNYASWLSLRRKGHMMIKLYKDEIMDQISVVHSIQRQVTLPNEDGSTLTGFIDFEAELVGYEGIITIDNKTSSMKYKSADINDKGQLLIYDEYTLNGKGSYIVMLKKPKYIKTSTCKDCGESSTKSIRKCAAMIDKKRCNGELSVHKEPYLDYQILVEDIIEEKKDLHFNDICDILVKIENEEFEEDRDSCFQYGRKCVYFDYCRSDKNDRDIKGLIVAESGAR